MIVITVNRYMGFEAVPLIPHVTKCCSSYTGINWLYIKAANLVETWSQGCHSQSSVASLLLFLTSFPDSLLLHSFFFCTDPHFSAVSELLGVLIAISRSCLSGKATMCRSLVTNSQAESLSFMHRWVICWTNQHRHAHTQLLHIVSHTIRCSATANCPLVGSHCLTIPKMSHWEEYTECWI